MKRLLSLFLCFGLIAPMVAQDEPEKAAKKQYSAEEIAEMLKNQTTIEVEICHA